jgi:valyl-tRNA synthetase
MPDFLPYLILVLLVLSVLVVGHKYHIDTRSTIDELSKDRKLYQKMAWQEIEGREAFLKKQIQVHEEQESTIRNIILQASSAKDFVDSSETISKKNKEELRSRLAFVDTYKHLIEEKQQKNLRKGSPPGIERRF